MSSKDNKRKSRLLIGIAIGAALVLMALYWRCSGRGSMGLGSDQHNVSVPSSSKQTAPAKSEPPCKLRLDSDGLKLNGQVVELKLAISTCKKPGRATLFITGGANYTKLQTTNAALKQAGIAVTEQRKRPN